MFKKILLSILIIVISLLAIIRVSAAERKTEGFYVEVAPEVLVPLVDPGFSLFSDVEHSPGYGFRVSGGYDAKGVGVRGSLNYFQMREKLSDDFHYDDGIWTPWPYYPNWQQSDNRIDFFGADLDFRLYLFELSQQKNEMFQPYLVFGGGVLGASDQSSLSDFDDAIGFLGKLGGGLNIYVTDQISLGFETTYQPGVLFYSVTDSEGSHGKSSDLHFFNAAFIAAFHF